MNADERLFVRLADHVCLRLLETPHLYDRRNDELYELNTEGFEALQKCRGDLRLKEVELESDFLATCLEEGLLTTSSRAFPRPLTVGQAPRPSLRYLELQVTWRCNLACRHCYLGEARALDLPLSTIASLVREFDAMGGLRLLVSGGEPLLHPHWPEVNALLSSLSVRRVLLTNGTLLDDACLAELCFDEIQVSLDGLAAGHEVLRGPGTFGKAVNAAHRVREAGFDLSIATAAHPGNLGELEGLAELVEGLGAREWGIDVPCFAGRLAAEPGLALTPVQGAQAMVRAFGGAYHGSGEGMACGLHLCTVAADGRVAPCGFYLDTPLGRAEEGLRACWQRRRPLSLAKVEECAACPAAGECGGGCRFRAPATDRPDPVMCALFGV